MSLTIVGFAGRPVSGAAGIMDPVVRDSESGRFAAFHGGAPGTWCTDSDICGHPGRGLLTRIAKHVPYADGAVALYAHRAFVVPHSDVEDLGHVLLPTQLSVDGLVLEPWIESYVGILSRESAYTLLDSWGSRLLAVARAELHNLRATRSARAEGALREVLRARHVTAGRNDSTANELRRECVVLGWTALRMTGADDSIFRADAGVDFSQDELVELDRKAWSLFLNMPNAIPSRCRAIRRDFPAPPYRHQEDSQ